MLPPALMLVIKKRRMSSRGEIGWGDDQRPMPSDAMGLVQSAEAHRTSEWSFIGHWSSAIGRSLSTFRERAYRPAFLALMIICGCTPPGPRALLKGERLILEGKYEHAVEPLR